MSKKIIVLFIILSLGACANHYEGMHNVELRELQGQYLGNPTAFEKSYNGKEIAVKRAFVHDVDVASKPGGILLGLYKPYVFTYIPGDDLFKIRKFQFIDVACTVDYHNMRVFETAKFSLLDCKVLDTDTDTFF
ncbi:MAG: hypothetical protein ACK5N8_06015 [Alphaproteobacteria bacterium]